MNKKVQKTDIEIDGVYLDVEYDYTEAEPMVYNYGDGSGYPGCAAEVHIYKVVMISFMDPTSSAPKKS